MKIYIDYIFLENLFIDYILITETNKLANLKCGSKRKIVASIISASYITLMLFFKIQIMNFVMCKILLAFVTIYIAFLPKELRVYFKLTAIFMLVSILNLGSISVLKSLIFNNQTNQYKEVIIYILGLYIAHIILKYFWKIYRLNIKRENLYYEVTIKVNNKNFSYSGFLDTGNNAYSYIEKLPIVFAKSRKEIQKEILNKDIKNIDVKVTTLSVESIKKAYILEALIKNDYNTWKGKIGVVFENNNFSKDYDMILNYRLFIENMGGIKL